MNSANVIHAKCEACASVARYATGYDWDSGERVRLRDLPCRVCGQKKLHRWTRRQAMREMRLKSLRRLSDKDK